MAIATFLTHIVAQITKHLRIQKKMPVGSKVVLQLSSYESNPSDHIVFFDFFTNNDLLVNLKKQGFKATETLRENRAGRPPLASSEDSKKKSRGHYDYRFDTENSILVAKCEDNSVVTIGTNYDVTDALDSVKKQSASEEKKICVSRPRVYSSYNSGMGGVDLIDQATITGLQYEEKSGGGYCSVFTRMLNVTMVSA